MDVILVFGCGSIVCLSLRLLKSDERLMVGLGEGCLTWGFLYFDVEQIKYRAKKCVAYRDRYF